MSEPLQTSKVLGYTFFGQVSPPEKCGKIIEREEFGGFLPTAVRLKDVRQYRKEHLPALGVCQEKVEGIPGYKKVTQEGCMGKKAYIEICRQLSIEIVQPEQVCECCEYWECPIKKGTVLMDRL